MTIKLKNISGRNFNGVGVNETINVEEEVKNTYIVAGFVEVKSEAKKEEKVENKKATKGKSSQKVEVKSEAKKEEK